MMFYDVKTRTKVEIKDYKIEKDKRGRSRAVAVHKGTKLYRYV
jgi:hypothetical protein